MNIHKQQGEGGEVIVYCNVGSGFIKGIINGSGFIKGSGVY